MENINSLNLLAKQKEILETCSLENVCYIDNKFKVYDKNLPAVITSKEYVSLPFDELVGSWGGTSDAGSSIELQARIKINNEYSKYFSYGKWALKQENLYYNQDGTFTRTDRKNSKMTNN